MKISEVSEKYDLTQDTLRYYERIGLIPEVTRNDSGIRDYQKEDCYWIEFVKCMRGAGLPIEVLIEYMELFKEGDSTFEERKEILMEQREVLYEKLKDIKHTIERLDYKISMYEENLSKTKISKIAN